MRLLILFFSFFFLSNSIEGQKLKLYDWYSLQCYRSGFDVTQTPNYIVYNTISGLLFINKSNNEDIQNFTTIDGLSESRIQRIMYNEEAKMLFIYYADGSIDLMDSDRNIQNLQDIKNNNVLVPNKELNDIASYGRYIYLCLPFGLAEFDAVDRVFTNTLTVEGGVKGVGVIGSKLYIINQGRFYNVDRTVKPNISFIGNWNKRIDPLAEKDTTMAYEGLTIFKNQVFTTFRNNLFRFNSDNTFDKIDTLLTIKNVKYLTSGSDFIIVGGRCNQANLPNSGCIAEVVLYDASLQNIPFNRQNLNDNLYAVQDNDKIWFADSYHGYRYISLPDLNPTFIDISNRSPWSNDVVAIIKTPDALYVAPGGRSTIYNGLGNKQGLFEYKDGFWKIYNLYSDPFFASPVPLADFSNFAYNENTQELAIASYSNGIISIKPNDRSVYNASNSALQTVPGDPQNTRVGDVKFDRDGNLWAANVLAPTSVFVRTPDGSSKGFANSFGEIKLIQMTIDPINQFKWFVEPAKGIVVYDSGENILSASDDRWALVPVKSDFENQNILPRSIYSDSDGRIWIGTVSGVFVIDCGSEIFESNNSCETRYPYIQDGSGIGAFLNGQTVNVITEDGAGRKWFGTNTGIYVTNASVDEVILNLTPNNSPLADANVNVIEIDKKSGDVYIGTSAGVQIYKTDASIGNAFHDAKLVIYPNPVKPSYEGPIVIQGLAHESSVKIADVAGKLVFETQSLGSQAIWYGRDLNGNKVGTGVYTVFGTTTLNIDNPTGIIGKIIYIK